MSNGTKRIEMAGKKAFEEVLATADSSAESPALISERALAEQLFSKAPASYLAQAAFDELSGLLNEAAAALREFLSSAAAIVVRQRKQGTLPGLFTIMPDCPFIISSTIEYLRARRAGIRIILHPVFECDGKRIAFSYIELAEGSEIDEDFEKGLLSVLQDVRLVTSDFTGMRGWTHSVAAGLAGERPETAAFLDWLDKGSYLFLGTRSWQPDDGAGAMDSPLGLFRRICDRESLLAECEADVRVFRAMPDAGWVSRLNVHSTIQRRTRLHHILIKGGEGKVHSLLGVFTYAAHAGISSTFPVVRERFAELVQREKAVPNSYDYKHIVETVDRMPLDDALSLDIDTLQRIVRMTLGVYNTSETRVLVHPNPLRRTLTVLLVMARDRYTSEVSTRLRAYLEAIAGAAETSEYHIDTSLTPFARIYYQLPIGTGETREFDEEAMGRDITELSLSWEERMERELRTGGCRDEKLIRKYKSAFPLAYQALHAPNECVRDIVQLEQLNEKDSIRVSLNRSESAEILAVYRYRDKLILSDLLPVVEGAGLEVLSAEEMDISPGGAQASCFIYRLSVRGKGSVSIPEAHVQDCFCPGLVEVLQGRYEKDGLNSLMLSAGLTVRQISLLRTYCAHLLQMRRYSSNTAVYEAVASLPTAARLFWKYFDIRFSPDYEGDRARECASQLDEYRALLREVTDLSRDRIHKGLLSLLEHTVRTNYFHFAPAIAIKVESRYCEVMPVPRPHVEIFVRSTEFEGVHLRGGPVSRGGLRWSDRPGDFRNEILGLMKTQRVKNVLIAPDGAKGGFVVRNLPENVEAVQKCVVQAYENYIRSLLSVTDNRVNDTIVTPARVVAHDGPDPYLVVAADKGTAAFSDIANRIAVEEYNFWLGDAFASGGSKGYSHKALGITAKGAWECVRRHFCDIGLDIEKEGFTAIGIGDMGGDVFGNGLIVTDSVKLVAAFNHKHIFIDPAPDPKRSFVERKRLFDLPRSQWSDYDSSCLSKGGGVFLRSAKEIAVTPQMRAALGLAEDIPAVLDGEALISCILRAPIDLFWNGGIGTYVKSRSESHSDVNDGANDTVRVNSDELRCRIVGEGGNLGFTQRARIEFALRGGCINTDAVDNSAGVDLSDHEVNLKILLAEAIQRGRLGREERDSVLKLVTGRVVDSVLSHNRSHARSLSLGERRSRAQIDFYSPLITFLHKQGFVNRDLEGLPDEEDLNERKRQQLGLTRPELAIIMAGAKMWMKSAIINSPIVTEKTYEDALLEYFPPDLRTRCSDDILKHPLAANILALQFANQIVDLFGMSFVFRLSQVKGAAPETAIRCCVAVVKFLKAGEVAGELEQLDDAARNETYLEARFEFGQALRSAAAWTLDEMLLGRSLEEIEGVFARFQNHLVRAISMVLTDADGESVRNRASAYRTAGLSEGVADGLAVLPWLRKTLHMLWASHLAACSYEEAAEVFCAVVDTLEIEAVSRAREYLQFKDQWEHELFESSKDEIWRAVTSYAASMLREGFRGKERVQARLAQVAGLGDIKAIGRSAQEKTLSVSGIAIFSRKVVSAFEQS